MDSLKKIPPFWKKSLVVTGILAVFIALWLALYSGFEDRVSTKKAVVESGNAPYMHEGNGDYDYQVPQEANK